ncbi:MAG: FAD-dependent oxidoreductase [Chloroflexota bacterium]
MMSTQIPTSKKVNVVVIGGGGGGLCAAIAAAEAGAETVTLLEKLSYLGGDTLRSDQIISAGGTPLQAQAGIVDTPHAYMIDHIAGGRYKSDLVVAATLIQHGAAAWDWLANHGCSFPGPEALHQQHDHTAKRSVKLQPPGMVPALKQTALALGVKILFETAATGLLTANGAVVGVQAEQAGQPVTFNADAVILATGGFGRNPQMVNESCYALREAVSWNSPGNTGDGIRMAQELGAAVIDYPDLPLRAFRVIQTGSDVRNKVLHPTYLMAQTRGLGAILVATDGKRFYDEMGRSNEIVQAAIARGPVFYNIFDSRIATPSPWLPEKTFEEQWASAVNDGMVGAQADSLADLAHAMGLPAADLEQTIQRWNQDVTAGTDTEFGRATNLGTIEQPPFYAMRFKPAIVQTLGGLRINEETQVLTGDGQAIPGLYAVGQVTGGVHGADYIGGSSLLELVVFGKIAGENAVLLAA